MWFSFWRSKSRFSLDELRYLTEQLQKVQIVNEVNKDFVIEALRSIAELVTYGDQHDLAYFDFFMEKQVMGEFVRLLHISRTMDVSRQLLQTVSIMIQNLKDERAIHYLFSNEHINCLITYSFDFRNEELLSYYISFLRAISGKLDSNTISLLVKTENNEVVSFPLYVEALKFAFHDESMIRIAVRAITLNVYHGDEGINQYVACGHLANYFPDLINFLKDQCISLNELVLRASKNPSQELLSSISSTVDEVEDNLFYISDVISAGIPDVGRLIAENLLQLLILPLLLPSLTHGDDAQILAITTMYLLCCILRIVKIKDLANTVAAAFLCPPEVFKTAPESTSNGQLICSPALHVSSHSDMNHRDDANSNCLRLAIPEDRSSLDGCSHSCLALRESLLCYLAKGNDVEVLGSLSVLAVLLQAKELDESALEALGILPQRKQHKKLLLRSLVGESLGEEQLFSSESRDSFSGELDRYLRKLKEQYGISCSYIETRSSPRLSRFQVLDAIINLLHRTNISTDVLWNAGWLLCQLFPYSKAEINRKHLNLLRERHATTSGCLYQELRGVWADQLIKVLCDEWRNCKKVVEASFPLKELKNLLFPRQNADLEDVIPSDSSYAAAEKVSKLAKELVLLYQLQLRFSGKMLPDQPPLHPPTDMPEKGRAITVSIGKGAPRTGTELMLGDAIPCRISFGKGKERHFYFSAVPMETSGWLILLEELPRRPNFGLVRVVAPLAGSNPRVDEKHGRWLHLRIRPSTLPSMDDTSKPMTTRRAKKKQLVDGRWTLAFRDEESCKLALGLILEEMSLLSEQIGSQIKPLLNLQNDDDMDSSSTDAASLHPEESSSTMNL